MSQKKQVTFTVELKLAKRISLLRGFHRKKDHINDTMIAAIEDAVTDLEKELKIDSGTWQHAKSCPRCNTGTLIKRRNTKRADAPPFYGCTNFPDCNYREKYHEQPLSKKR